MDPKRYRLDIRPVGAEKPIDCGEQTFTALADGLRGQASYLLMVPASQPLEVYAVEVPPEMGGALH